MRKADLWVNEDQQKNRLQVTIFGQTYTMMGKASSSYMRMIASHVDDKMKEIAATNPRLDSTKLAVLSAMNIADEYYRLKQDYDDLLRLLEDEKE